MGSPQKQDSVDLGVNEYEGTVLSVIARRQPLTRYQLLKEFERSPTSSYNTSKGSLYPLVGRIVERRFVSAEPQEGKRASENLRLTELGHKALVAWILRTGPEHSIANDPLLLRLASLGDVSRSERIAWIAAAKRSLLKKKDEIGRYYPELDLPYGEIIQGAALAMIQAKLEWIDRLLIRIVEEP